MFLDYDTAHDIIHRDSGNTSATCPLCNNSIKKDQAQEEAGIIITRRMRHYGPEACVPFGEGFYIDVMKFGENGSMPQKIHLFPIGTFNTSKGKVTLTKDKLQEMAANFDSGLRAGVPIDIDHGESSYGSMAAGWIKKVEVKDDGLWASEVEWNDIGEDLVKNKKYPFISPEVYFEYTDPLDTSKKYHNVLIAGSLVTRPMFRNLKPLQCAEGDLTKTNTASMLVDEPMNIQTILAKELSDLSQEEKDFLKAHEGELNDEQKKKYGFTESQPTTTPETTKPADDAGIADKQQAPSTFSEDEIKNLQAKAEKGEQAFAELEKIKIEKEVNAWKFNEAGGKFGHKEVSKVVEFMQGLTTDQRKAFSEIMETLPDYQIFGEMGSDNKTPPGGRADVLNARAEEIAKERNIEFSDALKIATEENPELGKYSEDLVEEAK